MADERSVLVVGGGGREHALVWALRRSPSVAAVYAAPGNPGIAAVAETVPIPATAVDDLVAWAVRRRVGLVVVGPEAPLALGLADRLTGAGLPVFGPTRAAARLEWSKAFAKRFLREEGIATAASETFSDPAAALASAADAAYPLVVKADGLAAGKGVTVCACPAEADAAIRAALVDRVFGEAGATVVIEEFLEGEEVSLIALCDGERYACLPPARDYKRLADGDRGPNTGGMGAYAPAEGFDDLRLLGLAEATVAPTLAALRRRGLPYRGALYVGLMLTDRGPFVLEFNCRFGDPETQATLPLLAGDLAQPLRDAAAGRLDPAALAWTPEHATCLTLAAAGYPERPRTGHPIAGLTDAAATGALVFHAGTAERNGRLVTAGGRVLSVVGRGPTRDAATRQAYEAAGLIRFPGCHYRHDIAADVPQPVALA